MYEPRFLKDLKEEYHEFDIKTMREMWEYEDHPIIFPGRDDDLMCWYGDLHINLTMLGIAKYPEQVIKRTMQRMAALCDHNGGYLTKKNYEDLKAYAELDAKRIKKKFEDKKDGIEPDSNPDEITIGDKDSMKPDARGMYERTAESWKKLEESCKDECDPAGIVYKTPVSEKLHRSLKGITFKPHYIGIVRGDRDIPNAFDEKGERVPEYEVRPIVYADAGSETLWMRFGLLFWNLSKIGVDKYPAKILGKTLIHTCNEFLMSGKSPDILSIANEYSNEAIRRVETIVADKIEKGFVDSKCRDDWMNIELKKELIDDAANFWYDGVMPPTCADMRLPSLSLSDYSKDTTALARDFMEKHKLKIDDPILSKEDLRACLSKAFVESSTSVADGDKLKWKIPEGLKDGKYIVAKPSAIYVDYGDSDSAYTTYVDTDKLTWGTEEWAATHSTSGDPAEYLDRISTTGGSTLSTSESIAHPTLGYNYGKATNGYWLATLPPDKLAAYFACTTNCDRCKFCHDPYNCADGANCEKGIKLWLEEEYKDETEDE